MNPNDWKPLYYKLFFAAIAALNLPAEPIGQFYLNYPPQQLA
jgi:hypothetical protein